MLIENNGEYFRPSRQYNSVRRGRDKNGVVDDDQSYKVSLPKQQIGIRTPKNKRPKDKEKICQYSLQDKCLKVK